METGLFLWKGVRHGLRLVEVKHFLERQHASVGGGVPQRLKEGRHFCLPARIDRMLVHAGASLLKVWGLQVSDEEAVRLQEERIVVPARGSQRVEHFGPDLMMTLAVFIDPVRPDFQQKTNTRHGPAPFCCRPGTTGVAQLLTPELSGSTMAF